MTNRDVNITRSAYNMPTRFNHIWRPIHSLILLLYTSPRYQHSFDNTINNLYFTCPPHSPIIFVTIVHNPHINYNCHMYTFSIKINHLHTWQSTFCKLLLSISIRFLNNFYILCNFIAFNYFCIDNWIYFFMKLLAYII